MYDLAILFNIISLFVGVSVISISIFIYQTRKNKLLIYYIGFNVSFFLIQNSITLLTYSNHVENPAAFITILSKFLDILGTSFSGFFGILLIHSILCKQLTKSKLQMVSAICFFN